MAKVTICDLCKGHITSATETHAVIYTQNSERRVDCCKQCRSAIANGDTYKACELTRLILGAGK